MMEIIAIAIILVLLVLVWQENAYLAIVFNQIDEENRTAYVTVRSLTGEVFKVKVTQTDVVVLSLCGRSLASDNLRKDA